MTIFSCSACGGHAFKLSADLKQAHCEDCNRFLGGWTELKAKIKQNLRTPQLRVQAPQNVGLWLCTRGLPVFSHC